MLKVDGGSVNFSVELIHFEGGVSFVTFSGGDRFI